jgi:L,D-peptidoglycan transpeptidase YkuD (ErfK/YbiS/YcfS/YnhG family)
MKLSKRLHIVVYIFALIAVFASATYIKSASIFAMNEIQNSTEPAVDNDNKQLEEQLLLDKQKKLQNEKKIQVAKNVASKKKLEEQNKLNQQNKLQEQKKLDEKKKLEELQLAQKQQSSSKKQSTTLPPAVTKPVSNLLIDKIDGKGNARQAIVVTTNSFNSVSATIAIFEKISGNWREIASFPGNIGKNGFAYNKLEGDGRSPIGIFSLGTAFGKYSNPGTSMRYRKSSSNDFWVDDVNSSLYNTWQTGPANGRWSSAEKMYISPYNYGFVINYNTSKRIPGKGSAIFFHVWSGSGQGTAGCISAPQNNVISTLEWIDPSKNPVIIEGPASEVLKM